MPKNIVTQIYAGIKIGVASHIYGFVPDDVSFSLYGEKA